MKRIPRKVRSEQQKKEKRLEAVNVADAINRLMDPSVFPDLLEAVDNKDKKTFNTACKAAFIPNDMQKYLWKVLIENSIHDAKNAADAAFCWS